MITNGWAETLCCSGCGGCYEFGDGVVVCRECGFRFPVVDGIPLLIKDTTIGTSLDEGAYDEIHGITERTVDNTGEQWAKLIAQLGLDGEDALEIGAGSGVLTLGLLRHQAVRELTAIDVSHPFLRMLAPRVSADPTPVSFVVCDANEANFRGEAFGLVLGRSILHHLLDYDVTLRQCHAMLKPGGAAVFFEPVLEGKIVLTLLMALMLRCDETTDRLLSDTHREKIRQRVRYQTKSAWHPQDRESLSRLEDKYIFRIDELEEKGREAGFTEVEFLNNHGEVDPSYWIYFKRNLKLLGIPPETIERYAWIGEEFANTYGLVFSDRLVTPMGYFVFRK